MRAAMISWGYLMFFDYLSIVAFLVTESGRLDAIDFVAAFVYTLVFVPLNLLLVGAHYGIVKVVGVRKQLVSGLLSVLVGVALMSVLYLLGLIGRPWGLSVLGRAWELVIVVGWLGYGLMVARLRQKDG